MNIITERPNGSRRSQIDFTNDPGLTEQAHGKEADIHVIMRKAARTGMVEHINNRPAQYSDLASRPDFHQAMNIVAEAQSTFETIPAEIRARFRNDPAEFLDYINDPTNREDMQELGFTTDHLPPAEAPERPPEQSRQQQQADPPPATAD